jgi:monofunctional biosynthetic peptidoglycan transglycosylase
MASMKRFARIFAAFFAVVILYLLIAFVWAWRNADPAFAASERRHPPVDVRGVPAAALDAILRVEDPTFYRHVGVDPFTPGQGMTTITQAVARTVFIDERPGFYQVVWNHAKKIDLGRDVMALALARQISKQRQLGLFLSAVYMGRDLVGLPAAARAYCGKELGRLTREDGITLAAVMLAPNRYQPGTPAHAERVRRIGRLLRGECKPSGLLDVTYEGCGR